MGYSRAWTRLDNAAKIFPPTSTKRDPKVFRFACELYEDVDGGALQAALNRTLEDFPLFRSVIRRGLFWYYFEQSGLEAKAGPESKPPCSPLYDPDNKQLLFDVSYYKKRINLEVFHALADGTGALHFLTTLVTYYIVYRYPEDFLHKAPPIEYDASRFERESDSFSKYHKPVKGRRIRDQKAHQINGERLPEYRLGILEGLVSASAAVGLARRNGATITEYLTALLIYSIHEGMSLSDESRPVVLTVPVNLRKFFPSESSRNFFGITKIGHDFKAYSGDLNEILKGVQENFRKNMTTESLAARAFKNTTIEHNIAARAIPLVLKTPGLKLVNYMEDQTTTAAISNVGIIRLHESIAQYVSCFGLITSTNRLQLCMCSYQDKMMLSFTSPFLNTDIQRCFFRKLAESGVAVGISTNMQ